MESVTVITEPLLHPDFLQFHHVVPILERLRGKYDITVAAPRLSPLVQRELENRGMRAADGGAWFPPIRRSLDELPSFIGSWVRDSIWGWNRRDLEHALRGLDGLRVSTSMTIAIDTDVWQIQSRPLGQGLDALRHGVSRPLRTALTAAKPFVGGLDHHHVLEAGRRARARYASTQHVADWFAGQGLPVTGILPIYYRPTIHRSAQNPTRDYVLVYVGKETDTTAVRLMLDTGIPAVLFGSKSVGWVMGSLRLEEYPNARMLGHVTDEELSDLYSNARFTAFPFTEEPFGLIPLESMACGTPVLTYDVQGPAETVLDRRTGWLTHTPMEFARRAKELWDEGAPSAWIVEQCLTRARDYEIGTVTAGWKSVIDAGLERRDVWGRKGGAARPALPTPAPAIRPLAPSVTPRVIIPTARDPMVSLAPPVHPILPVIVSVEPTGGLEGGSRALWRSGGYPARPESEAPGSPAPIDSTVEKAVLDEPDELDSEPGESKPSPRMLSPPSDGTLTPSS